jgi:hypothetical protein
VQSFVAEDASAVGVRERHDDDAADFHGANIGADGFDDADGLVSHASARVAVFHCLVRPEIAAAAVGHGSDPNSSNRHVQWQEIFNQINLFEPKVQRVAQDVWHITQPIQHCSSRSK